MGVFEHFPYVNYHELNLSWILRKLKELEDVIGTQIVDLVARAGVAENAQAIADLTDTVEENATTAHNEATAAAQAAATADGKAVSAQTTANAAQSAANTANTNITKIKNITQLAAQLNVPTTETIVNCNWSEYNYLTIETIYFNNITNSIVVPVTYFSQTNATTRVIMYNPRDANTYWNIYKNDNTSIGISASVAAANYGIRIYGFSKN